ncbi:protein big brother-like isoform X1 [Xenia sp. Carnegie-2017]|uniref:protein big brother-like isoform X1 n=1 Tax=Xenia sp. Carnegie-2017 TaxID=2897299 RepID=UPI001F04D97F|nr:protein big brother-like isoform X1 [Xenia sp. Carnegie-2017]
MPRVVENQLAKFRTNPVFQQLQRQSEIKYASYLNCSIEERRIRFFTECYQGTCKIGFTENGINLTLSFPKVSDSSCSQSNFVDFLREPGKVFLMSPFIFNGVCVKFYGWLEVDKLRGFGRLLFDEASAQIEDDFLRKILRQQQRNLEVVSTVSEGVAKSSSSCLHEICKPNTAYIKNETF